MRPSPSRGGPSPPAPRAGGWRELPAVLLLLRNPFSLGPGSPVVSQGWQLGLVLGGYGGEWGSVERTGRGLGWEAATCPEPPIRQGPDLSPPLDGRWAPGRRARQRQRRPSVTSQRGYTGTEGGGCGTRADPRCTGGEQRADDADRQKSSETDGWPAGQTGREAQADRQLRGCQSTQEEAGRPSDPEPVSHFGQRRRRVRQRRRLPSEPLPRAQGGEEGEDVVSCSCRPRPRSGRLPPPGGRKRWEGAGLSGLGPLLPQRSPVSETLRATGVTSPPLDGDITPAGLTVLTFKAGGGRW